jgi:hypothetical protein
MGQETPLHQARITEATQAMSISLSDVALAVIAIVLIWAKLDGWG